MATQTRLSENTSSGKMDQDDYIWLTVEVVAILGGRKEKPIQSCKQNKRTTKIAHSNTIQKAHGELKPHINTDFSVFNDLSL